MKLTIFNLLDRQPAANDLKNRSEDALIWGKHDNEPLQIINTILASPTASAAFNTIASYIYGDGLSEKGLYAEKVNKLNSKTFDDIAFETAQTLPKLGGFAWHIKYTIEGGQVFANKIDTLPFESCRLGIPNEKGEIKTIKYNPYFGTNDYKRGGTIEYPVFNPDTNAVLKQAQDDNWNGQVFWFGMESEFARFYPQPYWWGNFDGKGGGKYAMENEYLLSHLLNKELDTGFLQNTLMKIVGDPDEVIPDKKDANQTTTVGKEFSKMLQKDFQGIDGKPLMILWSRIADEFPQLEAFPSRFNYKDLSSIVEKIQKEILAILRVPPILAGVQTAGVLAKDDIANAAVLMHSNIRFYQQIIERELKKVTSIWHNRAVSTYEVKLQNYNPFETEITIPDYVWAELDRDERRAFIQQSFPDLTLNPISDATAI